MSKPVIMVGDGGNNSVKESGAGFVVKSIEGLPDAIEELINSTPEERKRIGEKGRAFAKEYYDWKKLANKMVERIEEL